MEHETQTHRTMSTVMRRAAHSVYGFLYEKDPDFFPAYQPAKSDHPSSQN